MKASPTQKRNMKFPQGEVTTKSDHFDYGVGFGIKERMILKIVGESLYPLTPQEISSKTDIKASTVRKYVRKLSKRGFLIRKHHGHYISRKNAFTFSSSMVKHAEGFADLPRVHCLRLRFPDVKLSRRDWKRDFGVVRVKFQVHSNGWATVFVDCKNPYSLGFVAFQMLISFLLEELCYDRRFMDRVKVPSFEWNREFFGVRIDGVKALTLKAFDGSFRRIYNKKFGLRDEVKIVGSPSLSNVLALMQGGVSTYNIVQLLFANFEEQKKLVELHKYQNRIFSDLVSQTRRLVEASKSP